MVGLMVSCGAQPPSDFVESAAGNATYHSAPNVIGVMETISIIIIAAFSTLKWC